MRPEHCLRVVGRKRCGPLTSRSATFSRRPDKADDALRRHAHDQSRPFRPCQTITLRALEAAQERRQFFAGAVQNRQEVVKQADHGAGMSAQEHHQQYDQRPADGLAQGWPSRDWVSWRLVVGQARTPGRRR